MNGSDKRKLIHQRIFYLLILSIVFFIPLYGRILPPLISLLFLNWLIEGTYIKTFLLLFKEKKRIALISFSFLYFLYLLGLTYSSNMTYGLFDVEVKLSILIFPLIFATSEPFYLQKEKSTTILFFFIAGCFISTLLLYAHATYAMLENYSQNAFYYVHLSWYHHPSYLAMNFTFAIAILAYWLIEGYPVYRRYQLFGTLIFIINFFIFIVLLNSKAGMLSLFMVMIIYSIFLIVLKHNWLFGTSIIIVSCLIFWVCLTWFPYLGKRLNETSNDLQTMDSPGKDPKSTAERIIIWKSSLEIIREHPIFGVGTGDVKDALMERYKAKNLTKLMNQRLNAHNQYFQTFISLGIFGLMTLLYMLVFPAIRAFHQKDLIYIIFLALFAVNITVESMLENQAGVIFYALFNALLFVSYRSALPDNPFNILIRQGGFFRINPRQEKSEMKLSASHLSED
jgi:O-antigen ligase